MSYSFCFGPSGSGKSHYLRKMIIERAGKSLSSLGKDRTKYIVIVPEQYSMQTQHELIDEDPRHVLMNVDVLSFGRLAHRVFSETGEDRRAVLDDIGKSLLLRRAASGCFSDLQILRRGIHSPGMIDEIKSVLSEFMQYGIGLEQIEEMAVFAEANKRNALSARLRDIKKLYAAFREAKEDRYVTSEETMDLLAAAIPKAVSLRGSVIVFDGFTGFTTVQYRVVTELIRCAKEVIFSFTVSTDSGPDIAVTADGGSEGAEENLFYLTRKTVKDIIRIASKERLPRGKDIYFKLIKEYTEKQWGKDCKKLPAFIIKRLPVRFTYDNNYFNDRYQGIPIGGYNKIIEKMLYNADVELGVDYLKNKEKYNRLANKIVFTGMIDEYFDYKFGNLEWRSLKFENEIIKDEDNFQGNAVVNYTSHSQKYTRIIEHKHFEFNNCSGTVITREYPMNWKIGDEAYYPVNDDKNNLLFEKYKKLAEKEENVIFGGRLGNYKYYDMDKVIKAALEAVKQQ